MSLCSLTLELLVHTAMESWQESQVRIDPLHIVWQQLHDDISLPITRSLGESDTSPVFPTPVAHVTSTHTS